QDRISEVWAGVCSARSSNLVRAVELIVANPNIHIQEAGMIRVAGPQGSKRSFDIDAAVFADRVAYEIRFGISLFPQKPKSPLRLLLQSLKYWSRPGLLSKCRIRQEANGKK